MPIGVPTWLRSSPLKPIKLWMLKARARKDWIKLYVVTPEVFAAASEQHGIAQGKKGFARWSQKKPKPWWWRDEIWAMPHTVQAVLIHELRHLDPAEGHFHD